MLYKINTDIDFLIIALINFMLVSRYIVLLLTTFLCVMGCLEPNQILHWFTCTMTYFTIGSILKGTFQQ